MIHLLAWPLRRSGRAAPQESLRCLLTDQPRSLQQFKTSQKVGIEDRFGAEKIQPAEPFFPIIAASSHFLSTMR